MLKKGGQVRIVLVTCGSRAEARRITRKVVTARLAACVNIVSPPVDSTYRWKGKVESAREFLLVIKTAASCLVGLENEIKKLHSYDVPEFLVLPVSAGSADYLKWLRESVNSGK